MFGLSSAARRPPPFDFVGRRAAMCHPYLMRAIDAFIFLANAAAPSISL